MTQNIYNNDFLNLYMELVEHTESPRVFHVWSALTGVAACMGRKTWLPWVDGQLFSNVYVLLVGSPASRKSTAMKIMEKRLKKSTGVRFAQDDCGGKRQGLVSAMVGEEDDPDIENVQQQIEDLMKADQPLSIKEVGNIKLD